MIDAALRCPKRRSLHVGFLLYNVAAEQAAKRAGVEGQRAGGAVPMSDILSVPEHKRCLATSPAWAVLSFHLLGGQLKMPWSVCLFLAAVALPLGEHARNIRIFELDFETIGGVKIGGTRSSKKSQDFYTFSMSSLEIRSGFIARIGSAELRARPKPQGICGTAEVSIDAVNVRKRRH